MNPQGVEPGKDIGHSIFLRIGVFSWASLGVFALTVVIGFLIIEGRIILAPLFLAMVIVFLLNPVVSTLERLHIHRVIGTTVGFFLITAGLVALAALVIPSIVEQGEMFAKDFPELYDEATAQTISIAGRFGIDASFWDYDQVVQYLNDPENQDTILSLIFDRIGSVTSGIFEFILVFLLGPVLAFYLLLDLSNTRKRMLGLVPQRNRAEVALVGAQLNTAVGGFLRGQLLVALFVGVMLSFGYWFIDLPFWLLIGLVGGFLNIVPFLGPWVGGILGVIVAFATTDLRTAFWAAVVAIIVQQIDNNFISPLVLKATVRLHPAVTLTVLVLAGAVAGFWGIIIAVPLAATIKVIGSHLWRTRILGETWEEAGEAIIAEPTPPTVPRRFRTREMDAIDSDQPTPASEGDSHGDRDADGDA